MVATIINFIGAPGLIIVLAVLILFLGGNRFPEIARSLRRIAGEFARGKNEGLTAENNSSPSRSSQKSPERPAI